MTKYTDPHGNQILLCDHCRQDMPGGSPAFTLAPGRIADGYISRDYDKGEMVLCPECAQTLGQVLSLLGVKRADGLLAVQEAA